MEDDKPEDEKVREVVASYGFGAELSAERTTFGWKIKANKGSVAKELQGLWSDFETAKNAIEGYVSRNSYAFRVAQEEKQAEAHKKSKPKKVA